MTKIGSVFQFTVPAGWKQFQEGERQIFHGANREELIVSAWVVQGSGQIAHAAVQERLFKNAEQAVKSAAADTALKVTRPFQKDTRAIAVDCWSLQAETLEGDTSFYQAVFRASRGVLLGTLEAPKSANAERIFEEFIASVEPNGG